ncbi:MAG: ABC transporter permease [bacterium]|nr:ABC transporter permease [bacterium]
MKQYGILAARNIRKNMSQYISFGIILILAVVMFHLGLLSQLNFSKSFDKKWEDYHSPDTFTVMMKSDYQPNYLDEIKKINDVESVETREALLLQGSFKFHDNAMDLENVFFNKDESHSLNEIQVVEKTGNQTEQSAYVSQYLSYAGYKLGDTYTYTVEKKEYSFIIDGFVEDMVYGGQSLGLVSVYLPEKSYQALQKETGEEAKAVSIFTKCKTKEAGKTVSSKIADLLMGKLSGYYKNSYFEACKNGRTITANMIGAIFIAFALIVLVVSLLVSNFRINSSIEEEIKNMGVLKALGYTGNQIILSMIMPYIVVGIVASLIGIIASYFVVPVLQMIYTAQTGVIWEQGIDVVAGGIVLFVVVALITAFSYLTARKIRRMAAIIALRGGKEAHDFKKNHFPMEETKGTVSFIMSCKMMLTNGKQNVLLFLLLIAVMFAGIFAGTMFYNISVDANAFINALVETKQSITLNVANSEDTQLLDKIKSNSNVKEALYYDGASVMIDKENIAAFITDDFSKMDNDICYKGRNPEHANEVAVGSELEKSHNLKIGDKLTINYGTNAEDYMITGFIQSVDSNGVCVELTTSAYKKIDPEYKKQALNIYLKDESVTSEYIDELTKEYGGQILSSVNAAKSIESSLQTFKMISGILCAFIIGITIAMILIILYMVIKTIIIRKKVDFGIAKAIGFTTNQLILQTAVSLLPIVCLGGVIGAIVSYLCMNSVIANVFHLLGVLKIGFIVPVPMVVLVLAAVIAVAFFSSLLVSRRIKKISAYELITE